MKKFFALIAALAIGCGGEYEDPTTTEDGALGFVSSGYAQLEQPLTSETISGGGTVVGTNDTNTGGGPAACSTAVNNTCFVPNSRITTFCVEPTGWSSITQRANVFNSLAPQLTAMQAQLAAVPPIAGEPANWVLTMLPLGTTCNEAGTVRFVKGALPNSGDAMSGYVQVNFLGLTTLTESLPGAWKSFSGVRVTIDYEHIFTRGANPTEDSTLLQHALAQGAAAALGAGSTFLTSGTATQSTVTPITGFAEFTAGQACRLNRYKVTGPVLTYATTTSSPACPGN